MLYLIESGDYYKIGTTTDIKRRMQDYRTHNPDVELID
jgi:predicted GIY-YIG superfamily endonuclease